MARTAATEPEASRTAYTAASPVPAADAAARPPTGASSSTAPAATAPLRREARSRRSRRGMCAPTVNISITKPMSPRNRTVGSAGSTASSPVRPTTTPATISPITTGTNTLRPAPSSGPARPASTIKASTPKVTVAGYARRPLRLAPAGSRSKCLLGGRSSVIVVSPTEREPRLAGLSPLLQGIVRSLVVSRANASDTRSGGRSAWSCSVWSGCRPLAGRSSSVERRAPARDGECRAHDAVRLACELPRPVFLASWFSAFRLSVHVRRGSGVGGRRLGRLAALFRRNGG